MKKHFAETKLISSCSSKNLVCSCWLSSNTNTHYESWEESSIQQDLSDDKEHTKAVSNIDMLNT